MPQNPSSSSKMKFSDNEKLLCYHGPLLYEAKCVKTRKEGQGYSYYVHYQGWNKNWDEWVTEGRMLKINPESREMQKKLLEQHLAATKESKKKSSKGGSSKKNSSRASTPDASGSSTPSSAKKEDLPLPVAKKKRTDEDSFSRTSSVSTNSRITKFKISIPEELRYVLVNDWDLITLKKNLFNIPAKYSVSNLIRDYLEEKKKCPTSRNVGVVYEVMQGVLTLFNRLVGKEFLYKIEYKQYKNIQLGPYENYSDVYGTAHILRLLSKVDGILNLTRIEVDPDVALIESIIGDFLKYLEDNMDRLFTSKNYKEANDEYLKNLSL